MFLNGDWKTNVTTVGEAIAELSHLDPKMPIKQGFADSVDLVVFNRDAPDIHLSFEDGACWTKEG